jgi:dUTP pyrophosphatase
VATLHTAPVLLVQQLCPDAYLPTRGTTGAVGQDLYAVTEHDIRAGERALVSTRLAIGVPGDTYGQIAPRSGLALRQGVTVGTGVIDPDYRGEVKVLQFNHGSETFQVQRGMHIAQLILENCSMVPLVEVDPLPDTERDQDGFGSTGLAEMVDIFAIELGHANVKKIRPQEQRYADLRKVIPTEYHDYLDVFDEELGMSRCPEHQPGYDFEIHLKEGAKPPPPSRPYHLSCDKSRIMKEWLQGMEETGLICRSKTCSPTAAPVFFVPKKDGTRRPVINY